MLGDEILDGRSPAPDGHAERCLARAPPLAGSAPEDAGGAARDNQAAVIAGPDADAVDRRLEKRDPAILDRAEPGRAPTTPP